MKKVYKSPTLKTETIAIGVFGAYGSDSGDGAWAPVIGWFNPFFGLCCGG